MTSMSMFRASVRGPADLPRVDANRRRAWFIRELILQLKLGSISRRYFESKFGADPVQRFEQPVRTLKDWGYLSVAGDRSASTAKACCKVDRLLHEFFLPEHRNARYA